MSKLGFVQNTVSHVGIKREAAVVVTYKPQSEAAHRFSYSKSESVNVIVSNCANHSLEDRLNVPLELVLFKI